MASSSPPTFTPRDAATPIQALPTQCTNSTSGHSASSCSPSSTAGEDHGGRGQTRRTSLGRSGLPTRDRRSSQVDPSEMPTGRGSGLGPRVRTDDVNTDEKATNSRNTGVMRTSLPGYFNRTSRGSFTTHPEIGPRSSFSDNPRAGNPNEDTTGLVSSFSAFKFGSMSSASDQIIGTPATELGPFEYPVLNPVEDDVEDPTGRRLSESSLKGGVRPGPLGLPLRRPVEEAVAAGPGIGSLRRMSTMNQVTLVSAGTATQTEVRRPSVVHSNTVPLVTTTTGGSSGEDGKDAMVEQDDHEAEGDAGPDVKTGSLLQSRRATLDNGYEQAATGTSLALPPGSISAAAAGTVNLMNATSTKRRSILSFGREGPVDTPVPPSLAGLVTGGVIDTGASPVPSASKAAPSSMAALRRGSLPAVRYDPTWISKDRKPSISSPLSQPKFNSVDPARSAFARASFSAEAGPIVVDQGTKWERTTVSSAYLYARRNSLAHPIGPSLGLTGRASAAVAMRPGLAPFQPPGSNDRRPSEVSDDGRSASGSTSVTGSSTGSVQTLREARSGSAVSTVMGTEDRGPKDIGDDDSHIHTPIDHGPGRELGHIGFREDIFQQPPRSAHRDRGADPLSSDSDDYHLAHFPGKRSSMSEYDRRGTGLSMGSPRARLNSLGAAQPLGTPRGFAVASRFTSPSANGRFPSTGDAFRSENADDAIPRRSSASSQPRSGFTSAEAPAVPFSFGTGYNADSAFYTSSSDDSGRDGASSSSSISSSSSASRGRRKWSKRSSVDNGHRLADDAGSNGPTVGRQGEDRGTELDFAGAGSRNRGSGIGHDRTHRDPVSNVSSFSFSSSGGGSGSSSSSLEAFAEEPEEAEVEVGTPWTEVMVSLQHPEAEAEQRTDSGLVMGGGGESITEARPRVVLGNREEETTLSGEDDDAKGDEKKRDKEFRDFAFGKNALQRRQGSLRRTEGPAIKERLNARRDSDLI